MNFCVKRVYLWCTISVSCQVNLFIIPPLPEGGGGYTVLPLSVLPSKIFFITLFSVTVDGRDLIFGHKLHIGTPYRGKHFWTHQIPTSCLPTLLIFIHIEHICSFFGGFFSATIDGRDLIFGHKLHIGTPYRGKYFWTHQIPASCLPTLLIFIHIEHMLIFRRIFLSNYWLDPSESYFLFAEEQGYHKWALAHSSSCFPLSAFDKIFFLFKVQL
jgi:hypothetical protein